MLVDTLNMMISSSVLYKKSLADNYARFESCDCLWASRSIILTGALEFCVGFAVAFIIGIISVSDTRSLTDKVTLVLMWSLLSLTFFFIKAASLAYLLPMYSFALLSF